MNPRFVDIAGEGEGGIQRGVFLVVLYDSGWKEATPRLFSRCIRTEELPKSTTAVFVVFCLGFS